MGDGQTCVAISEAAGNGTRKNRKPGFVIMRSADKKPVKAFYQNKYDNIKKIKKISKK